MHDVEREIISITNYKVQRKFSDRQDYLKSLFNAIQKLGNDEFDELSDDAAIWANSCVEAYNSNKDGDLPDFDEIGDPDENNEGSISEESDDEDELAEAKSSNLDNNDTDIEDSESSDEGEGEEAEPDLEDEEINPPKKTSKKVAKPTKIKPKKDKSKVIKKENDDEEEVELDKWGCMVGSKNGRALAMFEKGATASEIKETFGGTYYNILKRMVSHGHKVEKKGSVIKLTHMTEKPSRVSLPKKFKK
jgi:hypothetical protein